MKTNRLISILLILSLVVSLAVFVSADNPASLRLGDVNGNGIINAADALEVLQYSVGKRDRFTAEISGGDSSGSHYYPRLEFASYSDFSTWLTALEVRPETVEFASDDAFRYIHPEYYSGMIEDKGYYVPSVEGMTLKAITVILAKIIYIFHDADGNTISCSYTPDKNRKALHKNDDPQVVLDGITYYYFSDTAIEWQQYGYNFNCGIGWKDGEDEVRSDIDPAALPGMVDWHYVKLPLLN